MNKTHKWLPDEGMPSDLAALSYLKSRLESVNKEERKCVEEALQELELLKNSSQFEKAAAWYYTTFCQAWGFGTRKYNGISTSRGWITPKQSSSHLGIGGESPHYLAIRPSHWLGWAAIDIDEGSRYHPMSVDGEGIEPVKEALGEIGLEAAIEFQSSTSGGIHLWYPLATMTQRWELAVAIEQCLLMQEIEIKNGVLELRPNKKRHGSDYLIIRAPLTGEGNSYWAPDHSDFGLHQDLQLFHQIWIDTQPKNEFKPLKAKSKQTKASSPNRRRPVESKYSLNICQEKLVTGFTGKGQTQDLKLAALIVARLIEGIEDLKELEKRVYELLKNAPGFEQFCNHQYEIKNGKYLTRNEINKTLQMAPGGYKNTWKEECNLKSQREASERATEAIKSAFEENMRFTSMRKAISSLQIFNAPSRSWWLNKKNIRFLNLLKPLLDTTDI